MNMEVREREIVAERGGASIGPMNYRETSGRLTYETKNLQQESCVKCEVRLLLKGNSKWRTMCDKFDKIR
jgi:hypothetical protein